MPDMLVGAGTVLTTEQADRAVEAGAKFIVSPGFNPRVVKHCIDRGIPVCPGCSTCGEMEQAMEMGLDVIKFFPAEAAGGLSVIKAVSAPYGSLKFMPTGGINETNLLSYLSFPKILACGGSFMVKDALIKEGNFAEIERLTRDAVALMHGFEIVHVGINSENEEECRKTAEALCRLFLLTPDVRTKAIFAGTKFEVMKTPFRGKNGHIAIGCNFPDRAKSYLERMGVVFDEDTAAYDEKGQFEIHLSERGNRRLRLPSCKKISVFSAEKSTVRALRRRSPGGGFFLLFPDILKMECQYKSTCQFSHNLPGTG